jgi:hypothetical protein
VITNRLADMTGMHYLRSVAEAILRSRHQRALVALSLLAGCVRPAEVLLPEPAVTQVEVASPADEVPPDEDEAREQLRTRCEARCGTIVDRDAIIDRITTAAALAPPLSSLTQDLIDAHGEPTAQERARFMDFVAGGPAVIVNVGYAIQFNPERVELDGRFGTAIFIDEGNRVVACTMSDPDRLATAVHVDCRL